jgi:hypothetical protein
MEKVSPEMKTTEDAIGKRLAIGQFVLRVISEHLKVDVTATSSSVGCRMKKIVGPQI